MTCDRPSLAHGYEHLFRARRRRSGGAVCVRCQLSRVTILIIISSRAAPPVRTFPKYLHIIYVYTRACVLDDLLRPRAARPDPIRFCTFQGDRSFVIGSLLLCLNYTNRNANSMYSTRHNVFPPPADSLHFHFLLPR